MIDLLKNSIDDFRSSYKKYISFALLYMLVTSFLFVPLISFIFNRMLRIIGSGALLNAEVYTIGLSTVGLISILLISFIAIVFLLIEFGVIIAIAEQNYFRRKIFVSDAFVTTLRKIPKIINFSFIPFLFLFLLFIPFIELVGYPALLDVNILIFLTDMLYSPTSVMILYLFLLLLFVYFFMRFVFTFHYVFIETKRIGDALKSSWKLTKYNKLSILITLFLINFSIFIVSFLIITLISYIPLITNLPIVGYFINQYLITFSSFLTIIFSLLLIPINVIIVTRLFYQYKRNIGEGVNDQLKVFGNYKLMKFEVGITNYFVKRKMILFALILFVLPGLYILNDSLNDNVVYLKWNVQVAAHRGDSYNAPENSISSIRSAIERGVDAVEFDVMLSKDGVVVLHHDTTLERVAGLPYRVSDLTYEELAQVDIGRFFSKEFIGEKMPSLEKVFQEVKDENVRLIIDLKPTDATGELAKKVVELIEKYDMVEKAYVQAFDYPSLQVIRSLNSDIKIGQILFLSAGDLAELDVDFYTIRQTMLTERFIRNARAQNREIWVWTVNIDRNIREVLKYDIDGIITGRPEKVQRVIGIDFALD